MIVRHNDGTYYGDDPSGFAKRLWAMDSQLKAIRRIALMHHSLFAVLRRMIHVADIFEGKGKGNDDENKKSVNHRSHG